MPLLVFEIARDEIIYVTVVKCERQQPVEGEHALVLALAAARGGLQVYLDRIRNRKVLVLKIREALVLVADEAWGDQCVLPLPLVFLGLLHACAWHWLN